MQYALRDAKDMIDLMPRLSKGYLRCGKVLQLKGEPIVALKIYERGLKKVRVGADKDRTVSFLNSRLGFVTDQAEPPSYVQQSEGISESCIDS